MDMDQAAVAAAIRVAWEILKNGELENSGELTTEQIAVRVAEIAKLIVKTAYK